MRIGTLGTGNMARAVGGSLADAGHEVMLGSRDAEKARAIADELGRGVRGGTNDEAAEFAEIILHTVREVPSSFLRSTEPLAGTIIIDLNNRDFPRDIAGGPLFPSLHAQNQADVPKAQVVKCFNTMAMQIFAHDAETLRGFGVAAYVAGGNADARRVVADLATQIGFEAIDMGGADTGHPQAADVTEMHGDFIRTLIFGRQDPMMTSQARSIPTPASMPYGEPRY
ncbi:MAG: NAD(P)-binding domain-containing protein [Planctomycetota bacterium]